MVIIMPELVLQILILVTALSVDSFAAGFAYGVSKIKVPLLSVTITALITSFMLIISLLVGNVIQGLLPPSLTSEISFLILFILGSVKLWDHSKHSDAEQANKDGDDNLSPIEALTLGFALSIDSIAAGVGAGVRTADIPATFSISLLIGASVILLGCRIGNIISSRVQTNLSWVSGILLIILAIMKLL